MGIGEAAVPLQIGSTVLSVEGDLARGRAASLIGARRKAALDFEAKQLEIEAGQAVAAGQRNSDDIARKVDLVNSAALARAAASGAGASDPTVMAVLARTKGEGAYRQALAMYEGEAQARLDRLRASAATFEGDTALLDAGRARSAANNTAAATLLSGAAKTASLYDKYYSGPSSSDGASAVSDASSAGASDIPDFSGFA